MGVADLLAELAALQRKLTLELQSEYFCDDLELPPTAFGWSEQEIRDYFESGGESAAAAAVAGAGVVAAPVPPPPPRAAGRPAIVCLGDGCVELASHMLTAESVKHEKSPPLASELLVSEGAAAPIAEQGPGWLALLARDYAWRSTADVLNRGHSGYTTRLALEDLPQLVASLPRSEDVLAVLLQFGGADCSAEGALHVPTAEFGANLAALLAGLQTALPAAKLVVMTPPVVVDAKWAAMYAEHGGGGHSQSALNMMSLKAYGAAASKVVKDAKDARCSLVDVHAGMTTRLMQFNDALGPSGRHLSQKGNNFVYRMLKEHLQDDLQIGPRTLASHRPPAHRAAYPDGIDGDAKLRKAAGKRR